MAKRFPVTSSSADGSPALAFTAIHIAITASTVTSRRARRCPVMLRPDGRAKWASPEVGPGAEDIVAP